MTAADAREALTAQPIRRPIDVAEIAEQRAKGWPDFHPEDYCHRCGGPNISWWIDAAVWNPVMRPDGEDSRWNEIICPVCFADLFGARYPLTSWRLVVDGDTRGGRAFLADAATPEVAGVDELARLIWGANDATVLRADLDEHSRAAYQKPAAAILAAGWKSPAQVEAALESQREGIAAALSPDVRLRCPVHGIPDCSPLLNGCKIPGYLRNALALAATLARTFTTGAGE